MRVGVEIVGEWEFEWKLRDCGSGCEFMESGSGSCKETEERDIVRTKQEGEKGHRRKSRYLFYTKRDIIKIQATNR